MKLPAVALKRKGLSLCNFVLLLSAAFLIGGAFVTNDYPQLSSFRRTYSAKILGLHTVNSQHNVTSQCETPCKPRGSETLPRGIVSSTSDLKLRPLWDSHNTKSSNSTNLLAIPVGIRQKDNVDKIVKKFLSSDFLVMLFHYDGNVDGWRDTEWSDHAIHVSAINQTKWWFAKRFLHPDIVSEYAYIFLWDEDLGVENFHVGRYLSIVKEEGLEISQPALDPNKSEIHHQITERDRKSKVHRRIFREMGGGFTCNENSTSPPCTGWVEIMAPVFSRASWRCVWHMIQNDLTHAWGLDYQLGYCAQGDRMKKIGVVDSEYIVHSGSVTLGSVVWKNANHEAMGKTVQSTSHQSVPDQPDTRSLIRNESFAQWRIFLHRWRKSVEEDHCWTDPY